VTPLREVGGFYDDRSYKYDRGYIHLPSGLRVAIGDSLHMLAITAQANLATGVVTI